jgi:HD-like signal output (HDOD) protein
MRVLRRLFQRSAPASASLAEAAAPPEAKAPAATARRTTERAPREGETAGSWFSPDEIADLGSIQDENELARRIARLDPTAGREETLFRYHLSRTVYFQDFELPVLPATATEVLRLGRDASATVRDYVGILQSDPSLVSAIVRVANSSFYAAVHKCASLDQAIVRIGLTEVQRVTSVHVFRSRMFRVSGHDALVGSLVQHGIDASIAAQWVLRRIGASRAEAFLAGLFHDVGKLFLLQTIARVQRTLAWTAPPELVRSAFDAFHPAVGELACSRWGLPETVCQAVRWHHDPQRAAEEPIRRAAYLGNRIVHAIESGADDATICAPGDPVLAAAELSVEQLAELRGFAAREIEASHGALA